MQVFSESVAKALQETGGKDVTETVHFMTMMDKVFELSERQWHVMWKEETETFPGSLQKRK